MTAWFLLMELIYAFHSRALLEKVISLHLTSMLGNQRWSMSLGLGIDIITGHLVWINGPFPAGAFPDIDNLFLSLIVTGSRCACGGWRWVHWWFSLKGKMPSKFNKSGWKSSYASTCLQQTGDNQHALETVEDFEAGIQPCVRPMNSGSYLVAGTQSILAIKIH